MVGGSAGDGRIGGGGFCCVKSMVGEPACEWVSKDGSAVGGLVAAMGGCVGCSGSVGGGGCVCVSFFFFLVVVAATIFLVVVFFFFLI